MITTKEDSERHVGRLFMVATPIGNVLDVSTHCAEVLATVTIIGCESINRTKILLNSLRISYHNTNFIVLNDPREQFATRKILEYLLQGLDVACVTDAGTPLVSDPGFELVRLAYENDIKVTPIPGPSSLTSLLSICPIPTNQFQFVGYLQRKKEAKKRQLLSLQTSSIPTVFFEAPQRIVGSLELMLQCDLSERTVFIGRELTKKFEEHFLGSVKSVYENLKNRESVKGEFTAVLAASTESTQDFSADALIRRLIPFLKVSQIAGIVSDLTAEDRSQIYDRILLIRDKKR